MVNMYYVPCFVFNARHIHDHFSVQLNDYSCILNMILLARLLSSFCYDQGEDIYLLKSIFRAT
jgi:hypothetical protein